MSHGIVDSLPQHPAVLELLRRVTLYLRDVNGDQSKVTATPMPKGVYGEEIPPVTGNAPTSNDKPYAWHIDGDPLTTPPGPFSDCYGRYGNRSGEGPRFVSVLVYLNEEWDEAWEGRTEFLDRDGEVYKTKVTPGGVILLDMDITHRVETPKTRGVRYVSERREHSVRAANRLAQTVRRERE